jgi:hypothetical protein
VEQGGVGVDEMIRHTVQVDAARDSRSATSGPSAPTEGSRR